MPMAANGRVQYSKKYLAQIVSVRLGLTDEEWDGYITSLENQTTLDWIDPFVGTKPCWQGQLRCNVEKV